MIPLDDPVIDWDHPYTRGLAHAWVFGGARDGGTRVLDLAGQSHGALPYGATWETRAGRYALKLNGGNQYADCGVLPGLAGATKVTICAGGSRAAGHYWALGDAGGAGNQCTHILIFSNDICYMQFSNGAVSYPFCAAPTGDFDLAVRYDAGESGWDRVKACVNGVPTPLTPGGGNNPPTSLYGLGAWDIGRERYTSRYSPGTHRYVYVWIGRTLDDGQLFSVHADPYQFLAQRRRRAMTGFSPLFRPWRLARPSSMIGSGT